MTEDNLRLLLVTTGDNEVRRYFQNCLPNAIIVDCESLGKTAVLEAVALSDYNLLVTYRCPYIIPFELYGELSGGAYNIHPTLLPKYKGLNPWEELFKNGDKVGGVTLHRITEQIDSGEILCQESFEIESTDTIDTARHKSDIVASRIISNYLEQFVVK